MALSLKKQTSTLAPSNTGRRQVDHPAKTWSQVAARNIVSWRTPTTPAPSNHAPTPTSSQQSQWASSLDVTFTSTITPYIVGLEKDSVLIDITQVRDVNKLKQFLGSQNNDNTYHFFGTLLIERKYLQRRFIETCWDMESPVCKTLLGEGLTMDDHTVIRGYRSLPADAKIARVKVERLPLIHPLRLREQMVERFSHFGEVLDAGLHMDGNVFYGQGYVVLNLNKPHVTEPQTLSRIIDWGDKDRDLLLTWDEMPPFCRFCQKYDHCRADCDALRNSRQCFNCNERGHISRDCPRRSHGLAHPPNKRVVVGQAKLNLPRPKVTAETKETSSSARTSSFKRRQPAVTVSPAPSLAELTNQGQRRVGEAAKIIEEDHDGMEVDIEGSDDEATSVTMFEQQHSSEATYRMDEGDRMNEVTLGHDGSSSSQPGNTQPGSNLPHHL
ncbi:hypothetical protein BD560DRAFT_388656 [Blakeslea trispora]|nr:hypothetical protein BD560DRAFT_388656 [Blakeslea trispora]